MLHMEAETNHKGSPNKRKWSPEFSNDNRPKQRYLKKFKTEPREHYEDETNINSETDVVPQKYAYFEKILPVLKAGLPEDTRDLFVLNALKESKGEEVSLSCHFSSSRSIELLLSLCKNFKIWKKFMIAFAQDKETVYKHRNASHILELLLLYAVQNIENWSSVLNSHEDSKEKVRIHFLVSWIDEFGSFILSNVINCLSNPYASHVACSVIRALGGSTPDLSDTMSKSSFNKKLNFSNIHIGTINSSSILFGAPVALKTIPENFEEILKKIAECVQQIEDVSVYIQEGFCAIFFEKLIDVLKQRLSNECYDEFIKHFSTQLLSLKENDGVPVAFRQKHTSYIVEKLLETSDESSYESLWNNYFADNLRLITNHRISNFIIQKLFHTVQSKSQLRIMIEKAAELFDDVLKVRYYGIFLAIADACLRLKAHQGFYIKLLMQCLQCTGETHHDQTVLVPSLLCFKKNSGEGDSNFSVCFQGSLLVQKLFSFQKPIKLVKSLRNMKPHVLSFLLGNTTGCHVIIAFFNSSTVGEKSKDKLIDQLKPVIPNLACDRSTSLTLARIWMLLTLKQKSVVAEILLEKEEKLKSNKSGNIIFNKFKLFLFKYKNENWKKMQLELFTKKNVQSTD